MGSKPARDRLRIVSPPEPRRRAEATTGVLVGLTPERAPLVTLEGDDGAPRLAELAVDATEADVGRRVLVTFVDGDVDRPVITGLLATRVQPRVPGRTEIAADELFLRGEQEITLACGSARITLTRDGRVEIHGVDLLSRVSGTHRMRAGSIQLN